MTDPRTACRIPIPSARISSYIRKTPEPNTRTHRTHKALPAPLTPKCLNSLHPFADAPLAAPTLWHAQSHVARLAVRVPAVHRKSDIVIPEVELAVAPYADFARLLRFVRFGHRGREERVAALRAEEMLLVVRALPKRRIVQRDEALVDDRRLALIAPRREALKHSIPSVQLDTRDDSN